MGINIVQSPPYNSPRHGLFSVSIPRALAQALGIEKGHPARWVLRDGDLVLRLRKA